MDGEEPGKKKILRRLFSILRVLLNYYIVKFSEKTDKKIYSFCIFIMHVIHFSSPFWTERKATFRLKTSFSASAAEKCIKFLETIREHESLDFIFSERGER